MIPAWQVLIVTMAMTMVGFACGAAIFYPIGHRDGVEIMVAKFKRWYRDNEDPVISKIAADAARKVRGTPPPQD